MSDKVTVTCVYCGHQYADGTPAWGAEKLTEHIKVCEFHPMRKLHEDYVKVRSALVGLVGADSLGELTKMEAWIQASPMPDEDRTATTAALRALKETLT